LLDDWQASYRPPFEGIRVLGTRRSPRSYELRDFLARNHVPYQWIDVELAANDAETKRLLDALGPEVANLPIVLFPDGTKLPESAPARSRKKWGCGLVRKPVFMIWRSSVEDRRAWRQLFTVHRRACIR
jgi:thioredoxin reductase (NADPH)